MERLREKAVDIYKIKRPQSTRSMSQLPKNVSQKKLFGVQISIPIKSKAGCNKIEKKEMKSQKCSIPKNNNRYGKYLNCTKSHHRRLSKSNQLYAKRILKQTKEYRKLQLKTNSTSLEKIHNLRALKGNDAYLMQPRTSKNRKNSRQIPFILDKKQTKTYKKYLSVISDTCDFKTFLKKDQPISRKRRKRMSVDCPVKSNIIISPKEYQPKDLNELQYFLGKRDSSRTSKQNFEPSCGKGTLSPIRLPNHSKTESRYSKQMETRMAEHIIDASMLG
ncbi:unnamed protein product [Moneuplotes crassus]|uniref:Uncharacterized protein n=1 Tax=Euplotes crassus TaxID=5936 RepID=A0AAD1XFY3_EUPCR|nr:unnamed protein product [Moneuplotes crassus]